MMSVEDFTVLETGVNVALDGHVERCARCGRNGIGQDRADGTTYVIHIQISRVLGDGMLIEPKDYCVISPKSPSAVNEFQYSAASSPPAVAPPRGPQTTGN